MNEHREEELNDLYQFIQTYAQEKQLPNTLQALPLVRDYLSEAPAFNVHYKREEHLHLAYYRHCLSVCRMLIDLHAPIPPEEEDIALAAALCHVLIEIVYWKNGGEELTSQYHLHPEILNIIRLITRDDSQTDEERKEFYERIERNKLALLVKLVDRSNLVEQLYGISIWEAKDYVRETRNLFFPMCIYGKEHYPDLYAIISILLEKMRSLIEVVDILATRYQDRETALTTEILSLKEENARIRNVIAELEAEQNQNK